MNESVRIRGWLGHLEQTVVESTERWLTAYERMAAGTYDSKQAFADWSYFVTAGWISVLPAAPAAGPGALPLVLLSVHLGQATAAGVRSMAPAAAGQLSLSDLQLAGNAAAVIPAAKLKAELFDGRATLVVNASGLDAVNPALVTGQKYKGKVSVAGSRIADVQLVVLGAL